MNRTKIIKRLVYLILFILIVNFFANKFYLYLSIWYFDMIMHFLGGFWVGLVVLYLFESTTVSFKFIFKVLFFVLCIGIGWEVFEILVNDAIAQNPFNSLDTFSDIFLDLSGGASAVLYFLKRIMFERKSAVHPVVEL